MGLMFDTPHFELHADHGPLIVRVAAVMMSISFLGVSLRFISRRLVLQHFLFDDWIIVAALPFCWTTCILEIVSAKQGGLGRHVQLVSPETLSSFFKCLYGVQFLYGFSIAFTKFSILAFYRRIFTVKETKIFLMILWGIVGSWFIATILVAIFSCTPIYEFWDRTSVTTSCINSSIYYMAGGATNILTDTLMLMFPVPIIWRLQIFRAQKISILLIFLFGGFILVVSTLRLVSIAQADNDPDVTWAFLPLAVWNTIEVNVAIFCACIPTMRPLLRVIRGQTLYNGKNESDVELGNQQTRHKHKRWFGAVKRVPKQHNHSSFLWLSDTGSPEDRATHGTKTVISASAMAELQLQDVHLLKEGIHVEREIVWS